MKVLIARSQARAWEADPEALPPPLSQARLFYSLPGWSLGTQIRRLCLHFRAEAEPLDMGSQADPGNQLRQSLGTS